MSCGFNLTTQDIFVNARIAVQAGCYGFAFVNKGDTDVTVNDILLKGYPPGFPFLDGGSFAYVDEQGRQYLEKIFIVKFAAAPFLNPYLQITQNIKII